MRSDCPSIPTRGSRLVGLLSIIMTSVFGSGGCEQESDGSTPPSTNNKIVILSAARDLLSACSRATASRIRNLPQDRRSPRSRSRRHIAGPPLPRLVSEQRKSHRLLRFRRQVEFIREMQADAERCDLIAQHRQ